MKPRYAFLFGMLVIVAADILGAHLGTRICKVPNPANTRTVLLR